VRIETSIDPFKSLYLKPSQIQSPTSILSDGVILKPQNERYRNRTLHCVIEDELVKSFEKKVETLETDPE
jgi:hypothetical protein